jgi:mevalonate kinase
MNRSAEKSFKSQTKLMVTGEYLVLKGALSLALPLKYSQQLTISEHSGTPSIKWKSQIKSESWFNATYLLPDFKISETNNNPIAETLSTILQAAKSLNPSFVKASSEYTVTSVMDFEPGWGIGSSSSLISNIAYWADCDPYTLNLQIFNGSGYDIACARSSFPIIYKLKDEKPFVEFAKFNPPFYAALYFVYLNKKQNSRESILKLDKSKITTDELAAISQITNDLVEATDLESFQLLMEQHERIIANIINAIPIKTLLFSDFRGSIKSLGAWGGDFIMVASNESEKYIRNYFTAKNLETIFRYDEIVLG